MTDLRAADDIFFVLETASGVLLDVTANDINLGSGDLAIGTIDVAGSGSDIAIATDGRRISYTPVGFDYLRSGEEAVESFEYTLTTSTGHFASAEVTVTILGVDQPPRPVDDLLAVPKTGAATFNLLANDINPELGELRVLGVDTERLQGSLSWSADGAILYTTDGVFADLPGGEVVEERFSYLVGNETGMSAEAAVTIIVTGGGRTITGSPDDDTLSGGIGNDTIDGKAGFDTVLYDRERAQVELVPIDDDRIMVIDDTGDVDTLVNIEKIALSDGAYIFDIEDSGQFVYRLYAAAFGRTPDEAGFRFWSMRNDAGLEPRTMATEFINSLEFRDKYGYGENLTPPIDTAFVDALYLNVLGRLPDAAGAQFWLDVFDAGLSREDMLIRFADSQENLDNTSADFETGYWVI